MLILLDVSDAPEAGLRLGSGTADATSLMTAICDGGVCVERSRKSSAQTQGEASVQKPQPPPTERWPPCGMRDGDRSEVGLSSLLVVAEIVNEGASGEGGFVDSKDQRGSLEALRGATFPVSGSEP